MKIFFIVSIASMNLHSQTTPNLHRYFQTSDAKFGKGEEGPILIYSALNKKKGGGHVHVVVLFT